MTVAELAKATQTTSDNPAANLLPKLIGRPPSKAPQVITAFVETRYTHPEIRDEDQAVLAEVGRIATPWSHAL